MVTPHQTTFLKLLDAYLQPSHPPTFDSGELRDLSGFLSQEFFTLSTYAQRAIVRALGPADARRQSPETPQSSDGPAGEGPRPDDASPPQELDLLLPKVCEALVLVTQCLTSLCLISEESANAPSPTPIQCAPDDNAPRRRPTKDDVSSAVSPSGQGLIEILIGTRCWRAP